MDGAEKITVVLGLCVIFASFFFGLVTAVQNMYMSLSQAKVKKRIDDGDRSAELVMSLLTDRQRVLMTCAMGKVFFGAFIAVSSFAFLERFHYSSSFLYNGSNKYAAFGFAVMLSLVLMLIFGEVLPRALGCYGNYKYAKKSSRLLQICVFLMTPFTSIVLRILKHVAPDYAGWNMRLGSLSYEDERDRYVNLAKEAGIIEEEEKEMISSVFEFGDTIARGVMVPRPDIVALPLTTTFEDLLDVIAKDGHSRFPVYDVSIDKIVGILYVKDLIIKLRNCKEEYDLQKLLRKPFFVPETKNLNDLLREFQKRKQHLAVVVDEYGGVSGLVSIEDLLEEIVGEIVDEYDQEEQESIIQLDDSSYSVDARQSMPDLEGKIDCRFDYDDAETVGGFVMEKLGRIPTKGESFSVPQGTFTITETRGNRILKVKIELRNNNESDTVNEELNNDEAVSDEQKDVDGQAA